MTHKGDPGTSRHAKVPSGSIQQCSPRIGNQSRQWRCKGPLQDDRAVLIPIGTPDQSPDLSAPFSPCAKAHLR